MAEKYRKHNPKKQNHNNHNHNQNNSMVTEEEINSIDTCDDATLAKIAKKLKVKNILLGHHKDDVYENFIIRLIRGSGLNGMASFDIISINPYIPIINLILH